MAKRISVDGWISERVRDHRRGVEREAVRFLKRGAGDALQVRAQRREAVSDPLPQDVEILGRRRHERGRSGIGHGHDHKDFAAISMREFSFVDTE